MAIICTRGLFLMISSPEARSNFSETGNDPASHGNGASILPVRLCSTDPSGAFQKCSNRCIEICRLRASQKRALRGPKSRSHAEGREAGDELHLPTGTPLAKHNSL